MDLLELVQSFAFLCEGNEGVVCSGFVNHLKWRDICLGSHKGLMTSGFAYMNMMIIVLRFCFVWESLKVCLFSRAKICESQMVGTWDEQNVVGLRTPITKYHIYWLS